MVRWFLLHKVGRNLTLQLLRGSYISLIFTQIIKPCIACIVTAFLYLLLLIERSKVDVMYASTILNRCSYKDM